MSDWKFFVLGHDRTPLPNCDACRNAPYTHDREACECLSCHGFYAATSDPRRLEAMELLHPTNPWAVRTGRPSGIVVLDFEGPSKDPEGLTTFDKWESFTGWSLPPTRTARTPSGGLHLYFVHPGGKVATRNRVLPGMDVKGDGGYVVIPHPNSPGRSWTTALDDALCPPELVELLKTARGTQVYGNGRTPLRRDGYDFDRFRREGCPGGMRDEFFNDLIFRLRKVDTPWAEAFAVVQSAWRMCGQPWNALGAVWPMPWEHVEYKLHRVWRTVEPVDVPRWQSTWAQTQDMTNVVADGQPRRVGRVTLAPRNWKERAE